MESSLRKVQSAQLAAVAASFLRLRPRLLAPVGPVLLVVLYQARLPGVQLGLLALNFLCMLGFFFWESSRTRKVPIDERSLSRSLVITVVGLALLSGFSGGAESPFAPILIAPVGIAFAAFGRGPSTRLVLAALGVAGLYVLASSSIFPWPRIQAPYAVVIRVFAVGLTLTLLYFGVTRLAMAYRATAERLEDMRLEVIESTQRRTEELEALGDEHSRLLRSERRRHAQNDLPGLVIGESAVFTRLLRAAQRVADRDVTVLIQGETGTGKEAIAGLVHAHSRRSKQPLIRFNCGAVTESLAEAELFGFEKGAFTGAERRHDGYFNQSEAARRLSTTRTTLIDKTKRLGISTRRVPEGS